MRDRGIHNLRRALPRMTWTSENLYNLWSRSLGPKNDELNFRFSPNGTLFQKRWLSKKLVRAYHGDFLSEKIWKRWYMLATLPSVGPQGAAGDDKNDLEVYARRRLQQDAYAREEKAKGLTPVGSLMFSHVERRIDVFIFRCCFAHSVYDARRLVIHGYVRLNGKPHSDANTRLAPGDMVSVDPAAIRFFKTPDRQVTDVRQVLIDRYEKAVAAREKAYDEEDAEAVAAAQQRELDLMGDLPLLPVDVTETAVEKEEYEEEEEEAADVDPVLSGPHPSTLTPFHLPTHASAFLFIPAYIQPSFAMSSVYVRHPTARPGYSEIPTPYNADGDVVRFAWESHTLPRASSSSTSPITRPLLPRAYISQRIHYTTNSLSSPPSIILIIYLYSNSFVKSVHCRRVGNEYTYLCLNPSQCPPIASLCRQLKSQCRTSRR